MAKSRTSHRQSQQRQIRTDNGLHIRLEGSVLTINSDGMEQSWADASRPELLEFEYMQHMDIFLGAARPGVYRDRVYHAGAGGCALAKAWEKTRPQSTHLAVDMDHELIDFLKDSGWIKPQSRIQLRVADARHALERSNATYDVVVRDAFIDDYTPGPLTTIAWTHLVKSRLREGGLYLANVGHGPRTSGKEDVAAVATTFENIAVIAEPKVWRSQRYGNLAVAAWDGYELDWAVVNEGMRKLPIPARAFTGHQVSQWLAGARPLCDGLN